MVDFRPFRAVRYSEAAGPLDNLICPPYDVISPVAERELLGRSPHNMVRMELAELDGPPPPGRYDDAAAALRSMLDDGLLARDDAPAYYLLRQRFAAAGVERERHCLFGALHLEELGDGVLPHENTAAGPKEDRLALMRAAHANFSPILMLYRDATGSIARTLAEATAAPPAAEFAVSGEQYALWLVRDPSAIEAVHGALADEKLYVADGHHRYETSLVYREEAQDGADMVLTGLVAFDDPGLLIQPYYRVVHGASPSQMEKLEQMLLFYFVSRPSGTPPGEPGQLDAVVATLGQGQAVLGVVRNGTPPRLLTPANDIIPEPDPEAPPETQVRSVEAFVLQEMLFRPVFGDDFPDHVTYVHDGAEAMAMVERGEGQAAFFVKGLPADVFRAVVGAGIRLPRKSTYFYPKLPSGVVINLLDGSA
ncbi:MAG: DUF1015 domain-containing protein [Chloroflexota bacterium]|nr:DUF1015 domain-containing protein [Chloroflexota bacterium]